MSKEKRCPHTGGRDLIPVGDNRQLPPAPGIAPFWSTWYFQNLFEIFVLKEDRRHERDAEMRAIKEKLAWGGSIPSASATAEDGWNVDDDIVDFFVRGYLRGWGLTGLTIDLDIGTAMFPLQKDVRRWNAACVNQIEVRYGHCCEHRRRAAGL